MNNRRQVQEEHEIFLVDAFIAWWGAKTGEQLNVISRPHPLPPEAIVQSGQRTTWIEVTDAFHSPEWARDRYSDATPEEAHEPMGPGPHLDIDTVTAARFVALLKKKLSKQSYAEPHKKYGPGILLVGMESPWFDAQTYDMMRDECQRTDWTTDLGFFSHIFISFRSLNQQAFRRMEMEGGQARNPV